MCKTTQKYHSINISTGQTKYLTGQTFLYLIISYIIPISCPIIRTLKLSSNNLLDFPTDSAPSRCTIFNDVKMRLRKAASSAFLYKKLPVCGLSPISFNKFIVLLRSFTNRYHLLVVFLPKKKKTGNLQV